MSGILIDREIVHYEVLGRGRPVLFLHGWVGSWRYWIPAMQSASGAFRTYALDLWGFGDTAKNPARYALQGQVQLLNDFLYELGISRISLVGHGLGALVAVMFANQHPEAVDKILAVNCPVDDQHVHTRLRSSAPAALLDWLLGRVPIAEPLWADVTKTDPQAISDSFLDISSLKVAQLITNPDVAYLFVNSKNDPAISVPSNDFYQRLPEISHSVQLEGSGHFPMLEESSKFNRLVTDFLGLSYDQDIRQILIKDEWKRRIR